MIDTQKYLSIQKKKIGQFNSFEKKIVYSIKMFANWNIHRNDKLEVNCQGFIKLLHLYIIDWLPWPFYSSTKETLVFITRFDSWHFISCYATLSTSIPVEIGLDHRTSSVCDTFAISTPVLSGILEMPFQKETNGKSPYNMLMYMFIHDYIFYVNRFYLHFIFIISLLIQILYKQNFFLIDT